VQVAQGCEPFVPEGLQSGSVMWCHAWHADPRNSTPSSESAASDRMKDSLGRI